ncbi:MAG: FKBP-type peptidyl-prolyl cis-trans isomerase [Smithellaceae bacterium]|nr:FKBP-type peptidyl-prolyl cis-trans isomerase [Smithellaceae bacterium]
MKKVFVIITVLLLAGGWAEAGTSLPDLKAKESYSLGYEFVHTLNTQHVDIDANIVIDAVLDAFSGKASLLTQKEMEDILVQLRKKTMVARADRLRMMSLKNLADAKAFLEANKQRPGIVTLPDGLQYRVVTAGKGRHPQDTDLVKVRYRGTLIDGTEFDNSDRLKEPPVIMAGSVIKGWAEALPLMTVGSHWQLFVPPELGYGVTERAAIPSNSALIFDIELVSIEDKSAAVPEITPDPLPSDDSAPAVSRENSSPRGAM